VKRLAGLALLIASIGILGSYSVMASSTSSNQVYLPYVVNPVPTSTPTPTPLPGALVWTARADVPYWIYPIMGGAVINGQIYVVGPYSTQDYGDGRIHAVTYDPTTNSWTMRSGSALGGWFGPATATGAANGKIYVIAANPDSSRTTLEYNPASDSWTTRAPIPPAVGINLTGWIGASNGKLYAIGGPSLADTAQTVFLAYDPSNDTWSSAAALPIGISSPSLAATGDGKIYTFGNFVAEVYNTATDAWSTFMPKALVSKGMGGVQAGDGKIYLAGGPPDGRGIPSKIVLVYDPISDSWTTQTALSLGVESPLLLVLNGKSLYVIGGYTGEGWASSVESATIGGMTNGTRLGPRPTYSVR
jgi:N-acetylneuraminic acid mutarotase